MTACVKVASTVNREYFWNVVESEIQILDIQPISVEEMQVAIKTA